MFIVSEPEPEGRFRKCTQCGKINPRQARHCYHCGFHLGASARPRQDVPWRHPAYCMECGQRLPLPGQTGPTLTLEDAGTRRTVTLLFCDLSGFTAWAERQDPERVRADLDAMLGEIASAVESFGGWLDKFLGDGAMAIFGFPVALENSAAQAALAAIRMRDAVDRIVRQKEIPVRLKVGLHTGMVVAAPLGAGRARAWTVIGDAVNVAARLQDQARPGQILASEEVRNATEHRLEWGPPIALTLKGRTATLQAHELLAEKAPSAQAARERSIPLIGRRNEMSLWETICREAQAGRGRLVLITGETGIGKSRLASEFCEVWRKRGGAVLTGWALPHAQAGAYAALREPLRQALGLLKWERTAAEKSGMRPEWDIALAAALGIDFSDETWEALAPEEKKRRTLEAAVETLLSAAKRAPLLLLLEDAQWLDAASREVVGLLCRRISERPVVIVEVARSDAGAEANADPAATRIRLTEVSSEDIYSMACAFLQTDRLPEEARPILARSQGNPLFLEEILKALLASETLRRDPEGWKIIRSPEETPIPATLQGIMLHRFDRLPARTRRILQAAAVLGHSFRVDTLQKVLAGRWTVPEIFSTLKPAEEAGIVLLRSGLPPKEYAFRHILAQETLYAGLLEEDRKRLHAAAAQAISGGGETPSSDSLAGVSPEEVAGHWLRSAEPGRATPWLLAAGRRASDLCLYEEALRHFQAAEETGRQTGRALEAAEAGLWKGRIHGRMGRLREAVAILQKTREEARALGAGRLEAAADCETGRILRYLGETSEAIQHLRRAFGQARLENDAALVAEIANQLGGELLDQNRIREAAEIFEAGREAAEKGHPRLVPYFINRRAEILIRRGRLEEAEPLLRQTLGQYQARSDERNQGYVLRRLGEIAYRRGRIQEALSLHEESWVRHRRAGDRPGECWAMTNMASVKLRLGLFEEAIDLAARAAEMASEIGLRMAEVENWITQASCRRRMGRLREACELEERAFAAIRQTGDQYRFPRAAYRLAAALWDLGEFRRAKNLWTAGLEAAVRSGDRETEGRILLRLAGAAREEGLFSEADRRIRMSLEIGRKYGLPDLEFFAHFLAGRMAAEFHDLPATEEHARRSRELAERIGDPGLRTLVFLCEACRLNTAGDPEAGLKACREALEIAERQADRRLRVVAHCEAGIAAYYARRPEDSRRHYEAALQAAEEAEEKPEIPRILVHLGAALLEAGEMEAARETLERCLALCSPANFRRHTWRAHRHLAEWHRRLEQAGEALRHEEAALQDLSEILAAMPPKMASDFLAHGDRKRYIQEAGARLQKAGLPLPALPAGLPIRGAASADLPTAGPSPSTMILPPGL